MTEHVWLESAAPYALGALDADERESFEAHLDACDRCRAEVASFRETAAMLAWASPGVEPDPRLRERILAEARQVTRIVPAVPRQSPGTRWYAIAASVALLLMAAYAWSGFSDRRSVERELALVRADLDSVRRDLIAKQSTLAAFLGPEVHSVSLTAADGSKPAVRVFWNHTRNVFIVTAFDLPPAPAGRTYQLWAIAKDRPPRSMGTFDTDAEAGATIVFPVTDAIGPDDYIDSCGLTIEPAGGSGQPSEAPRLMGDWRHTD